jgi:ion channel
MRQKARELHTAKQSAPMKTAAGIASVEGQPWLARWRDPVLTALLVLLSFHVFVGEPLSGTHIPEAPILGVVWFLLVVSAVLVAARHWIAIAAILLSSMVVLLANILRLEEPSRLTICLGSGSLIIFLVSLSWVVWKAVYGPGIVTQHRVVGAVVLYLSIALLFAALYQILLALVPNSISGVAPRENYLVLGRGLIYYSLTTITSTGYGDLLPTHPLTRSVSTLEAVIGHVFPATLLARIVALEIRGRGRNGAG